MSADLFKSRRLIHPQKPLVTVVTVVFNAVNTISETIESIALQTYDNIQYIVIDGGSDDGTLKVINKYLNNIDIFISEKDNGIFDAMNKGLLLATGSYINFMNSGDWFADNRVVENVFVENDFDADFIYGDTIANKRGKLKLRKANPFFKRSGINAMGICHQSIFLKTELAKKYTFDKTYYLTADYKMIYLIFKNEHPKVLYIDRAISIFDSSYGITSIEYEKTFGEVLNIYSVRSHLAKFLFLTKSHIRYRLAKLLKLFKEL